jgi:transcriptional regulator with XRE-family HTH domain
MEQKARRNAVGQAVRRARVAKGWSQDALAAKLQLAGGSMTRGTLAKVESGIRGTSDIELFLFSEVLGMALESLFPRDMAKRVRRGDFVS